LSKGADPNAANGRQSVLAVAENLIDNEEIIDLLKRSGAKK
jgi:hypothetical protein